MMEMMGATITPALAALARSARLRNGRFFVFHLLVLGWLSTNAEGPDGGGRAVAAVAEGERARPWLGSFMVAVRGGREKRVRKGGLYSLEGGIGFAEIRRPSGEVLVRFTRETSD